MPKKVSQAELDAVFQAVARFPEGAPIEEISGVLEIFLPRRTLQRHLARLDEHDASWLLAAYEIKPSASLIAGNCTLIDSFRFFCRFCGSAAGDGLCVESTCVQEGSLYHLKGPIWHCRSVHCGARWSRRRVSWAGFLASLPFRCQRRPPLRAIFDSFSLMRSRFKPSR